MASLTRSASLAEHLEASGAKNSSDAAQKLEDEEIETLDDLLTIKPDKLVGMLRELCGMKTGSATKVEAYLEQYRSGGSTQPSGHGSSSGASSGGGASSGASGGGAGGGASSTGSQDLASMLPPGIRTIDQTAIEIGAFIARGGFAAVHKGI